MRPLLALFLLTSTARAEPFPPFNLPTDWKHGPNIQRTMRKLAESTAEKRNTVRILFYGQSITEQKWTEIVVADLKKRFPHADILAENRSLGGFASQILVKTAEADLYPFAPDLLVFHVYGAHNTYEDIIRRVRERTTAEILQQTDHVVAPNDFTEETDPAKLPPAGKHWNAFMNHNWLPSLSKKYGTELCDQRALWKHYLTTHKLEPKALLSDAVHLNAHGEFLMAECVKAYLQYDPKLGQSPAEKWITTLTVGKDVHWKDDKLTVPFDGSRIEAVLKPGTAAAATVTIDGKKPSNFPGTISFTRAVCPPDLKWPLILKIGSKAALVAEEWTLTLTDLSDDRKTGRFRLRGSVTGDDGEGELGKQFVSRSGRVVIEADDWRFDSLQWRPKPLPKEIVITWSAVQHGADEFVSPGVPDATLSPTVVLANGLPNGPHTLEICGSPKTPIAAIRIHRPPFAAKGQLNR